MTKTLTINKTKYLIWKKADSKDLPWVVTFEEYCDEDLVCENNLKTFETQKKAIAWLESFKKSDDKIIRFFSWNSYIYNKAGYEEHLNQIKNSKVFIQRTRINKRNYSRLLSIFEETFNYNLYFRDWRKKDFFRFVKLFMDGKSEYYQDPYFIENYKDEVLSLL